MFQRCFALPSNSPQPEIKDCFVRKRAEQKEKKENNNNQQVTSRNTFQLGNESMKHSCDTFNARCGTRW